jgi:hypothetical protein
MPIFHLVNGVSKMTIHSMKYHSWVHGFVDLGQMVVQMFDATPQTSNVAWLHNSMLAPSPHSMVILAMVSCKQVKAQSMGVDKPLGASTLSQRPSSSHGHKPPN